MWDQNYLMWNWNLPVGLQLHIVDLGFTIGNKAIYDEMCISAQLFFCSKLFLVFLPVLEAFLYSKLFLTCFGSISLFCFLASYLSWKHFFVPNCYLASYLSEEWLLLILRSWQARWRSWTILYLLDSMRCAWVMAPPWMLWMISYLPLATSLHSML